MRQRETYMKLVVHTLRLLVALAALVAFAPSGASAQGVTTGSLAGVVIDQGGSPVAGANVIAIHVPSGSTYDATTRSDGRFLVPACASAVRTRSPWPTRAPATPSSRSRRTTSR